LERLLVDSFQSPDDGNGVCLCKPGSIELPEAALNPRGFFIEFVSVNVPQDMHILLGCGSFYCTFVMTD
jgi:hypothetical protein